MISALSLHSLGPMYGSVSKLLISPSLERNSTALAWWFYALRKNLNAY